MYVILVYDISVKRVARVLKKSREYLYWVQNSVFEGEITPAKFRRLKDELAGIIDPAEDSVIIYEFRDSRYSSREVMGKVKGGQKNIL